MSSSLSLSEHDPTSPIPPLEEEGSISEGILATSHDHNTSQNPSSKSGTRRRASTLVNSPKRERGSKLFPAFAKPLNPANPSASTASTSLDTNAKANSKPTRPPKSPFRPRFPSLSTSTSTSSPSSAKRKRVNSEVTVIGAGTGTGAERRRQDSQLSLGGLEYLRGILNTFRQGLRSDIDEQPEPPELQSNSHLNEKSEEDEEAEEETLKRRERLTSISLSAFFGQPPAQSHKHTHEAGSSSASATMSLSDQRSTQRLINEFMEDLTPRSPTGSYHSQNPSSSARHAHIERIRRAGGHRRTHSSPGPPPTLSAGSDTQSERGRTLSGGTFGKSLARNGDSDGLMSDIETLRSGRVVGDGTASAPISPALTTTSLPPVQLPFMAARRSNKSPEFPPQVPLSNPNIQSANPPKPVVQPQEPPSPKVFPPLQLPSPPPLSPANQNIPTPLMISPPLTPPPETRRPSLPPPTSPLPALPSARTSPHTPSRSSSIRDFSPDSHPFAAVVAMMEAGDSPTKRRSRAQLGSEEVLRSPSRKGKGKERAEDERPHMPKASQGRKQTPRRGFMGPGGIIPRLASRSSLAKLKLASIPTTTPNTSNPAIVAIPPSPPDTAKPQPPQTVSPLTPNSTTYLRPAPATPLTPFWSKPRFAMSTSARNPSPIPSSISRGGSPSPIFAPRSGTDGLPVVPGSELVEIPRFKKKELNLGIVRRRGLGQRITWLGLWAAWLMNGLLSLFFDLNVMYILVHAKSWQFTTAAYAVLWAISTLAVWLGWEVGYEFWRRWRLPRPAVEPIYLSLPASLHLSLRSFNHFTFLLHIRTSPLNTPHSRDIIPETCYSLLQLIPGLLPLLPRAAIAVVVLISFWSPAVDVQAQYGGAMDQSSNRDSNFFKSDSTGELTTYAKGVLLTFTVYIALRLLVVIGSGIGLWVFSGRPLGGLVGHRFNRGKQVSGPPTTPRKSKSSYQARDPSTTSSPQKSWVDQENEFQWAWRDRTRSRIQDAFELCMIRRNDGGIGRLNSFLYQSEIPWGRMMTQQSRSSNNLYPNASTIELNNRVTPGSPSKVKKVISAGDFIDGFVEGKDLPSITTTPDRSYFKARTPEPTRPESTLEPSTNAARVPIHPSPSRANTAASSSATDIFYTPFEGNTPQTEKTRSVAEGIHKIPTHLQITRDQAQPPPSAYKSHGGLDEFGVKEKPQARGGSPDSANGSGEGDDESTGLLTHSTANSARNGVIKKSRSRSSTVTSSDHSSNDHSNASPVASGNKSRSSSFSSIKGHNQGQGRKRAYTSGSPSKDSLRRTRSSSITLLRESVTNAANASGQLIRRARSGTVLSTTSKYSKMGGSDGEEGEEGGGEEVLDPGKITPRSRRGTGLGMGLPFAIEENHKAEGK
uniref:Uncharacterized protein n=1 Tax=Kwoniella dejecticola CBS 10117 TaxID=1296121 RepID=A0A1A6AFH9_9TREE|nr:uncharacterized protein I303_00649 [Kwoniella dejecticola CBS 10117]OBR88832.1 hypothetical protein I303_00649 [Kwoniella dejecticola CBS 10117]